MQLRMNCFKVEWCVALLIFMSPLAKVETFFVFSGHYYYYS